MGLDGNENEGILLLPLAAVGDSVLVAISDTSGESSGLVECDFIVEAAGVIKKEDGEVGSAVGAVSGDEESCWFCLCLLSSIIISMGVVT